MYNLPFSSTSMINLNNVTNDIVSEPKCLNKDKNKKKSSSWLASLARSKSLRRTSLRLQKWLSSDNIFKQQNSPKENFAKKLVDVDSGDYGFMNYYHSSDSSQPMPDAFLDKTFFSSINCREKLASKNSAEFYPGAFNAQAAINPAKRSNLVRSTSGAVNVRRNDRKFRVQRSQSHVILPRNSISNRFSLDAKKISHNLDKKTINNNRIFPNKISGQNLQIYPSSRIKPLEPLERHGREVGRTARGINLHRSVSMSAQLDCQRHSVINPRPPGVRRFQSRDIAGPTDVLGQRDNVVFHYPPNGCHNKPVLHVPKIINENEADQMDNLIEDQRLCVGKMRLHERRSQSLDTLLEELSDHTSSPLPPPVFGDFSDRVYTKDTYPDYDIPTNNCKVFYVLDEHLSPVNHSSLEMKSHYFPKTQCTINSNFCDSSDVDKNNFRPNVASFSSSSPDSNDEPFCYHSTRSASPIYAKLNFQPRQLHTNVQSNKVTNFNPGLSRPPLKESIDNRPSLSLLNRNWKECSLEAADVSCLRRSQTPGNYPNAARLCSGYHPRVAQKHIFPLQIHPAFVAKSDLVASADNRWCDINLLPELPVATSFVSPGRFPRNEITNEHRGRLKNPLAMNPVQRKLIRRLSLAEPLSHKPFQQQRRRGLIEGSGRGDPQSCLWDRAGLTTRAGLVVNQRPPLDGTDNHASGSESFRSNSNAPSSEKAPRENQPVSPKEAVRLYSCHLTDYEHGEICQYDQIWYVGASANKVRAVNPDGQTGAPGSNPANYGFDDDQGNYIKISHDHIGYRYEVLDVIGRGSFGQVIRALDHKNNVQVAIKIIRNKKRFHQQALMEVKILDHLRRVDQEAQERGQVQENGYNVVRMLDCFYFRDHLCVVFQLLGLNLFELIKRNNYRGLSLALIRKFAISMIQCLQLLHREGIIHCDLKPENVLLKSKNSTSIRIIDFGSSCYTHQRVYTYIQSRFYRSPEVILGLPYDASIDMWSFGCILAELYTGFPLFPGENEVEQLSCIMECLDMPPENLILHASRRRLFFDSRGLPRTITNTKGRRRRPGSRPLSTALKCSDVAFLDLVQRCLTWDSSKRIKPDDAARHSFLAPRFPQSPAHANLTEPAKPIPTEIADRLTASSIGTAVSNRQVALSIQTAVTDGSSVQTGTATTGDVGVIMISTECQTEPISQIGD